MVALAAAGGSGDVDDALLQRVAQILSENDSGSSGGGFRSGGSASEVVDDQLLARVADILSQNQGSSSGGYSSQASQSYSAPAPARRSNAGLQIDQPRRAQQVASFDLNQGGRSRGAPLGSYSPPARNGGQY